MHIKETIKRLLEGKGLDDALTDLLEFKPKEPKNILVSLDPDEATEAQLKTLKMFPFDKPTILKLLKRLNVPIIKFDEGIGIGWMDREIEWHVGSKQDAKKALEKLQRYIQPLIGKTPNPEKSPMVIRAYEDPGEWALRIYI